MITAARAPTTVTRQQIIVLENSRFMECLLTTVKHKWISQIREHITTPLMARDVESFSIFYNDARMQWRPYAGKARIFSCFASLTTLGTMSFTLED